MIWRTSRLFNPRNRRAMTCALLLVIMTGCAAPVRPSQPEPEGRLAVMGPTPAFNLDAPPRDWIISAATTDGQAALSAVTVDGVPALEIKSGAQTRIAVRQVNAMLLATPYLSWSWNLSPHGAGIHPVRIVVGFQGGAADGKDNQILGGGLPDHDRALALVWNDTALKRGTLSLPPPERPFEAPLYTVRGGRENTRRWWLETVDLADFYARAWPNDAQRRARIAFIGVAAAPQTPTVRGRVSGILLSH